ncbi:hypothetical protein R5Q06_00655 [Oenococcus oeni]|uniref:hypothetical protein n=1 Tax=Oenococcus oeni TaxID=1247 RepID=UPI000277BB6D|nr:hypothetical protein [Oenococcus oeni]EJO04121.1 hypothetical protein AWRIB548_1737 [Oenococcus oeni AWRIB548]EJO04168.1 hypothetical protein AWRIB548_1784 [Oenococcus oeni AWRIB548]KEP86547.1 hypothetical protein X278_02310 [Oenococcus oeni IOEB_0205]
MIIRKQIKRIDQRINGYKFDFQFAKSKEEKDKFVHFITELEIKKKALLERQEKHVR